MPHHVQTLSLLALLAGCAAAEAPADERADAAHTPPPESPAFHGMVLFGSETLHVSHLSMWHSPHDWQVILPAELLVEPEREDPSTGEMPFDPTALYRKDRDENPETEVYTLAPLENFRLSDLQRSLSANRRFEFRANVVRGHFDLNAPVAIENALVRIRRAVHFRRFDGTVTGRDQFLLYGSGTETFLSHLVTARTDASQLRDFDQILRVTVPEGTDLPVQVRIQGQTSFLAGTEVVAVPQVLTPSGPVSTSVAEPIAVTVGGEIWRCPGTIGDLPCRDLD